MNWVTGAILRKASYWIRSNKKFLLRRAGGRLGPCARELIGIDTNAALRLAAARGLRFDGPLGAAASGRSGFGRGTAYRSCSGLRALIRPSNVR